MKTYLLIHEFDGQISIYKFCTERDVYETSYWGGEDGEEIQWILNALNVDFEPERGETILIQVDMPAVNIS